MPSLTPILPDLDTIKRALGHDAEQIRLMAVSYCIDALQSPEQPAPENPLSAGAVMAEVIACVEQRGTDESFSLLRKADALPQNPDSIAWLIEQLERDLDLSDPRQDNYRFAVALVLEDADPALLLPHREQLLQLLPKVLLPTFEQTLEIHGLGWSDLWARLEAFGQKTMLAETITRQDNRYERLLLTEMARCSNSDPGEVLAVVRQQYPRGKTQLMQWLEPSMIALAGLMRIELAIPRLIRVLEEDEDNALIDEVPQALSRINSDAVIQAVIKAWWRASDTTQASLTEPLEHIHTEAAFQACLAYINSTQYLDYEVRMFLCNAALDHLRPEAIPAVYRWIGPMDEDNMDPEAWGVRYDLVAAATILDVGFPDYDAWYQDAIKNNFGWSDAMREPDRRIALNWED